MEVEIERLPSLISIVGVDGSGKTTLTNWLAEELVSRNIKPQLVWSRFRNYLSKPMLAMTRVSGHNRYKTIDGVRFGFHDFDKLVCYREVFALLQAIDVNIGAYKHIHSKRQQADLLICERCPWDTLVDVATDTGLYTLYSSWLGKQYVRSMKGDNTCVIWLSRSLDKILETRAELKHDNKLPARIDGYRELSKLNSWKVIDNNGSLESTKKQILQALNIDYVT